MNAPLLFAGLALLVASALAQAEMQALDDQQLSDVQGAGFGFVLDNILLDANNATITITINDITNGSGQNVPISVKEFYLGATGSNKGANLNPVTIGRLSSPFTLDLNKGENLRTLRDDGVWVQTTPSNVAVLALTFPERLTGTAGQACISGYAAAGSNCSSRASEKADLGIRFDFQVAAGRTDILNIDIAELAMDGSYLRLWGDSARSQLVGEMRLNLYAKSLTVMSCAAGATNCATAAEQEARTITATNLYANIGLGYGKSQPLLFDVNSNGQFTLELPNPTSGGTTAAARNTLATDFYANAPRTNLVIDNLKMGSGSYSTGGYNFGYNAIQGLTINYLKVTSHDL
ncbi:hypothetical protein [Pseudomonas turukhanskensis]|uniref:Uncharacterized protein n=1 Tax=Pseudomonas turukhanskensis TaxID=1806536 RepID=A0A9W6K7W1_9PSED|nr:hypothetical protein [Pseudomonas turukhanskensis]GLK89330.1 hypothetical protein GCM10017655_23920 [Pseudomonas turukhanskensis]